MRLISWNVNGLRACMGKGFLNFFKEVDADFFCLQETKMQPEQLSLELPGYEQYWNSAEKKGYSGTAVFTRQKPLEVSYDLPQDIHNHEGRVITLEMEQFYLVTVYTPNSCLLYTSPLFPLGERGPLSYPEEILKKSQFIT